MFVLFMLQKNYQEPMDKVMANQQKPFPDLAVYGSEIWNSLKN